MDQSALVTPWESTKMTTLPVMVPGFPLFPFVGSSLDRKSSVTGRSGFLHGPRRIYVQPNRPGIHDVLLKPPCTYPVETGREPDGSVGVPDAGVVVSVVVVTISFIFLINFKILF